MKGTLNMAEDLRRDKTESYVLVSDSSWTLFYQHGRCTLRLDSAKVEFLNGSIIFSFYCFLCELGNVTLGICGHIWSIHPETVYTEPALNEEAAGSHFTSTKLGWPVCSCRQKYHLFWWWCCSADTQLFWSQFKSLSHNDVLCRAGFCLQHDLETTEIDSMLLTTLQETPSKAWNSPHLTSLPWYRDNNPFLTRYPSCSTQQIPNHAGKKRREGREGQMVSS